MIMRKMFLYSNNAESFEELMKPFIEFSGGEKAVIAFCCEGAAGWEPYFEDFRELCFYLGAAEVLAVAPVKGTNRLDGTSILNIEKATGIFITGGNTLNYWSIYCSPEIKELIRKKYFEGVPYAGLSAGSMIAADKVYCAEEGLNEVSTGLELVNDLLVVPHFSEWNMFPTLINDIEIVKPSFAAGIDENACLEITNETSVKVLGEKCFLFKRMENNDYNLKVLRNGDVFYV